MRDRARRDEDEARVAEATVAATVAAMAAVATVAAKTGGVTGWGGSSGQRVCLFGMIMQRLECRVQG